MALVPANDPAAMNNFLQVNLGVANVHMRTAIQDAGFTTLASLIRRSPEDFAKRCCEVVRKGGGNQPARKNVPVPVEEGMRQLVILVRVSSITGRTLDFNNATRDNLDNVQLWFDQCAADSPTTYEGLTKFSDSVNRKDWFDRLMGYLEVKVGPSGLPLSYGIRQGPVGPDLGFGLPSFEEEVKSRGRHVGFYWRGDNKAIWIVLRHLTEGTTAWSTI